MTSNLHNPVKKANKIPAIKAFIQTSFLDWRSQICSVVFLGRCNFRCPYCHNKDIVLWPQKLPDLPLQDIRDFISSHGEWLDGIVISGGEPCLDQDLPNLINEFRNLGLKIKLDTNGSQPELLNQLNIKGLIVIPIVRGEGQVLVRIRRTARGFESTDLLPVKFVPLLEGVAKSDGAVG